jgi:hypothetical protein
LQALAEPGSVVIAPATRRLLGNRFALRALGRHEVKGLAEPVEAWAVEGVSASEGRFEAVRSGRPLNHDPKTFSLDLSAQSTWMLGYPEQAVSISDAALAHARRRGHPFDLGWALTIGAEVSDFSASPTSC